MTTPNPQPALPQVAPNNLFARLTSGVHVDLHFEPHIEGIRAERLVVEARTGANELAFEVDWPSLEAHMVGGLTLERNGQTLQLSPTDVYEIGGLGWELLMRHGVVPTEWIE